MNLLMGIMNEIKYLRVRDIVTVRDRDGRVIRRGLLPISRSTWWGWVKTGKAPKPKKLGDRVSVWSEREILELVERLG